MGLVHYKKFFGVLLKLLKHIHKYLNFFMVFINIEQQANFRCVQNNAAIAFISFNHQPITIANFCIADFALLDDTG